MNSEFYTSLGQKIRERRKALRMTQSELCGDFVTRNMLSRIETGAAHPSLDTLLYIAERLKMPVEYFTATDKRSEAQYRRIESVIEIRRLFATGQYHRCIDLAIRVDSEDDEINFIIAECYYMMAKDNMRSSRLSSATENLHRCIESVEKCSYNTEILSTSCKFYLKLIECVRKGILPDAKIFANDSLTLFNSEFLIYVYSLCTGSYSDFTVSSLSNSPESHHIKAKKLMLEDRFADASVCLLKAMDMKPGFFTMYHILVDLEVCFQKTDNYKNAYEYTKRRLDLIDNFDK